MSPTILHVSSFLFSQAQGKTIDGTPMTVEEVLKNNMDGVMEALENVGPPDQDVLFLCLKKKLDNGDYRLGVAGIPVKNYQTNLLNIVLSEFKDFPTIIIDSKQTIMNIVRRVLSNIAFA